MNTLRIREQEGTRVTYCKSIKGGSILLFSILGGGTVKELSGEKHERNALWGGEHVMIEPKKITTNEERGAGTIYNNPNPRPKREERWRRKTRLEITNKKEGKARDT